MTRKPAVTLLVVCTAACTLLAASSLAQHITFQGGDSTAACIPGLDGNHRAPGGVVVLDMLRPDALPRIGSVVDAGRFSILLGDCNPEPSAWISAWFYSSTPGAVSHGRLNRAFGDGAGWQHQLLVDGVDKSPLTVQISPTVVPHGMRLGAVPSDPASVGYRVRYYRSGLALTQGNMISRAIYVLYYH